MRLDNMLINYSQQLLIKWHHFVNIHRRQVRRGSYRLLNYRTFRWLLETKILLVVCGPDMDPCMSSPCKNGGTCNRNGDAYTCTCTAQWMGTKCTIGELHWLLIYSFPRSERLPKSIFTSPTADRPVSWKHHQTYHQPLSHSFIQGFIQKLHRRCNWRFSCISSITWLDTYCL